MRMDYWMPRLKNYTRGINCGSAWSFVHTATVTNCTWAASDVHRVAYFAADRSQTVSAAAVGKNADLLVCCRTALRRQVFVRQVAARGPKPGHVDSGAPLVGTAPLAPDAALPRPRRPWVRRPAAGRPQSRRVVLVSGTALVGQRVAGPGPVPVPAAERQAAVRTADDGAALTAGEVAVVVGDPTAALAPGVLPGAGDLPKDESVAADGVPRVDLAVAALLDLAVGFRGQQLLRAFRQTVSIQFRYAPGIVVSPVVLGNLHRCHHLDGVAVVGGPVPVGGIIVEDEGSGNVAFLFFFFFFGDHAMVFVS